MPREYTMTGIATYQPVETEHTLKITIDVIEHDEVCCGSMAQPAYIEEIEGSQILEWDGEEITKSHLIARVGYTVATDLIAEATANLSEI